MKLRLNAQELASHTRNQASDALPVHMDSRTTVTHREKGGQFWPAVPQSSTIDMMTAKIGCERGAISRSLLHRPEESHIVSIQGRCKNRGWCASVAPSQARDQVWSSGVLLYPTRNCAL